MPRDYHPRPESHPGDTIFIDVTPRMLGPDEDPYGGVRNGRPGGTPPPVRAATATESVDAMLGEFTDYPIDPPIGPQR